MSALRSRAGPEVVSMLHAHLGGDDVGERGLAQPGRSGEQHVVQRLAPGPGGLDEDRELLAQQRLPGERVQACAGAATSRSPGRPGAPPGRRAVRPSGSGLADLGHARRLLVALLALTASRLRPPAPGSTTRASTGCSRSSVLQQLVGLGRRQPQLLQGGPGHATRYHPPPDGAPGRSGLGRRTSPTFSCSSRISRSAVFLPMPGTDWNSGHVAEGQRPPHVGRPARGERRQRQLGPDLATRQEAAGRARARPRSRSRRAAARPPGRAGR